MPARMPLCALGILDHPQRPRAHQCAALARTAVRAPQSARTERAARLAIAAEKSAEGIVGGATRRRPNGGIASRTAISRGPCGRKLSWRSPYEPGRGVKPEAPARKGPKPERRQPKSKAGRPVGRRWKRLSSETI